MITPDQQLVLEFTGQLQAARKAFVHRIKQHITPGRSLRIGEEADDVVLSTDARYRSLLNETVKEATSDQSISILQFLYHCHMLFNDNPAYFLAKFKKKFLGKEGKLKEAIQDLPRIDQTTLCVLLPFSETTIASRLNNLYRIDLINRTWRSRPKQKFIWITENGIQVVTAASIDGMMALAPVIQEFMNTVSYIGTPSPEGNPKSELPSLK